jgi:hypothetical protein
MTPKYVVAVRLSELEAGMLRPELAELPDDQDEDDEE